MKIPFDIKFKPQIESGEYKVAIEYDNCTYYARIVCWDFNSTELLACVNYGDREDVLKYDSSGKHIGKSVRRPDLFIITTEPELTEFEKAVGLNIFDEPFEERHIKVIKEESAKLLALARKELCEQVVDHTKEAFENGKAEALKDLPRWRKVKGARGYNYSQETKFSINGRYLEMNDTLNNIYEISFEELEKLSRL